MSRIPTKMEGFESTSAPLLWPLLSSLVLAEESYINGGDTMSQKVIRLSELLGHLQAVMDEHGDLPIWLRITWLGYDDTMAQAAPMDYMPVVTKKRNIRGAQLWFREIAASEDVLLLTGFGG